MNLHRYFPHTPEDVEAMLKACNASSLEDLYRDVPPQLRLKDGYSLPEAMSEKEIRDFFKSLEDKDRNLVCFAGAGFYHHCTPAVISALLSRSEYLTAYTPYQPEISQGTLQYIFEYQSMMASLTGLDVSNASMYDGATATAEAMMMAVAASRKRSRVLVSATVNPAVRTVAATYARYHKICLDSIPATEDGITDLEAMYAMLDGGDVAGVILPSPNYYGIIEDFTGVADRIHAAKALMIMNCKASSLAVLRTPGEWGADIAAGDAQSLGMPLNFGGPYLGFLCSTEALMRKMPGRIVGATVDSRGQRVFVLTLQAREQHIRRGKATSNICANQGLMALHVAIYLSLMGPQGMREVNNIGCAGAHALAGRLCATGKMSLKYPSSPFLDEFALHTDLDIDALIGRCASEGILAGVKADSHTLLVAVTEMQTQADMDRFVGIVENFEQP